MTARLQTLCGGRGVRRASAACSAAQVTEPLLRFVTYNVRRFTGPDGSSNVSEIAAALAALDPTLVALNEVDIKMRPGALEEIAETLGGFSVSFFGHVAGRYGNALLSKLPVVATRTNHLRGGTEWKIAAGTPMHTGEVAKEDIVKRIVRGMLECDLALDGQGNTLTVAVTHLDHIDEAQREIQLAHVLELLETRLGRTVLLGDLNALTRSDYTEDEWAALERRHSERGWAGPSHGCLQSLDAAGLVDVFAASRGGVPLSSHGGREAGPVFSAHVGHPIYRLDYCFTAATMLSPVQASVETSMQNSDHFPVCFDMRVDPSAQSSYEDSRVAQRRSLL